MRIRQGKSVKQITGSQG